MAMGRVVVPVGPVVLMVLLLLLACAQHGTTLL
jgi:hypothetical protein